MSDWYWKVVALKAVLILCCFVSYLDASDNVQKLPFCNPSNLRDGPAYNDLMIISTLDGKLTAFSTQNGIKAWTLETQPLLSSNLHNLELTSGGKWVRLVPSLRGTLYSLSGDTIEPLPFDAEQLLSSSYKYSDDLVIAGAKETIWQGIDANTGAVVYECGSSGCNSEHTANARDMLVLRRHSNTVRALDPRAGTEKWNFSVAEHQLALNRGSCVESARIEPLPVTVTVALHDARVALRVPGADRLMWQQKLEAPVAGMWRLQGGSLQHIDVLWEATQSISSELTAQPSLYIGVHDTQLYIQESPLYTRKLETAVSASPVPWKLVSGRPLLEDNNALVPRNDNQLSQVSLYGSKGMTGEYGFFLYLQETCNQEVQTDDDDYRTIDEGDDHHHIHVHVYSLWFWWKEVLLIAVSSAILMNLMIWPRLFPPKVPIIEKPLDIVPQFDRYPVPLPPPPIPIQSVPEYSGRYNSDFTPLRCLGRGGFGVVFEVRNNIDHCSYAVKRITLSNKESKRERVLREVRALAKLDHVNIVRYFNAWVEREPPEWQMQRDKALIRELESHSMLSEDYSTTHNISTPVKSPITDDKAKGDSVILNLQKPFDSDFYAKMPEPKRNRSLSCSDSIIFDSNAPVDHTIPSNSIVRSSSQDQGVSEAKANSVNKQLERVKECDYKTDSTSCVKKKKGHTRHWSLDACTKTSDPPLYLYIQMQLCRRDSLHDWLRNNRTADKRPAKQIKSLFSQIVSAVDYVHRAGLIHRDLKPSNILFSQDGTVKVGDFGLVTSMGDTSQDGEQVEDTDLHQRHTYRVGTHLYMSPEQAQCRPYSYKVDIYSLGLILLEMLQPFGTEAERVRCLRDARRGDLPQGLRDKHPAETKALELMLSEDPSQRPTAAGVRASAPLSEITDPRYHFTLPPIMC